MKTKILLILLTVLIQLCWTQSQKGVAPVDTLEINLKKDEKNYKGQVFQQHHDLAFMLTI